MPSPADPAPAPAGSAGARLRPALEVVLRLVALAAIVLVLVRTLGRDDTGGGVRAAGDAVPAALARWSADPELTEAHVSFDALPSNGVRQWIRALRASGVAVGYDLPTLAPLAVGVEAVADPARALRVLVAAPTDLAVEVRDALGVLDTLRAAAAGAELAGTALASPVTATGPGIAASAAVPDSLLLRPLLVLGRAGWESKFTIAALEERGWTVIARISVAPDVDVVQGAMPPLDTARLSAVIALDETAAPLAPAIARYVRSGGGLVLALDASRLPALAAIAPARAGVALPLASDQLAGAEARRGLPLHALTALRDDALALESRGDAVAVAARRAGAGRVVQLGYDETWRWRMAGPAGAPAAHRAWWAALVAGVASTAVAEAAPDDSTGSAAVGRGAALDDAPLARLIAAVGAPTAPPAVGRAAVTPTPLPWWALAVATAALLGEWASRRLRGVR
ncbi:MAG: hypothetical protein ACYC2G_15050 [Gemmatimonadaceae bacterium]